MDSNKKQKTIGDFENKAQYIAYLENSIEVLEERNEKLYSDCVSFAQKLNSIKTSGILDEDIGGLKRENRDAKNEIDELSQLVSRLSTENKKLKKRIRKLEAKPQVEEYKKDPNDIPISKVTETAEVADYNYSPEPQYEEPYYEEPVYEPEEVEEEFTPEEYYEYLEPSESRKTFRGIIITLLVAVILVGIFSSVCSVFGHFKKDSFPAGYRFYTVNNTNMTPDIDYDDVVVAKNVPVEKLGIGDIVITAKDGRTIGNLKAITVSGDYKYLTVVDNKNQEFQIDETQYQGKAVYRLAKIGKVASYAVTHVYNFFGMIIAIILLLIAILILVPTRKARKRKFGRDYDYDDLAI